MINWDSNKVIYFNNIQHGLKNYENETVWMGEQEAFDFFKGKWQEAEKDSVYADFYYARLEEKAKEIVERALTEEEKEYVRGLDEDIIYLLDEKLLKIITKLNARKILFSTVYFTGDSEKRSTWWGNYDQEYIVFREKIEA